MTARIGKGGKIAVPQRRRHAEQNGFNLSFQLLCECGSERAVTAMVSRGGIDRRGIVAPCCLRRYIVTGWSKEGPRLKCIGVEEWGKPGGMRIVPIPGETDDAEGLELLAYENDRIRNGDGWLRRPGTTSAIANVAQPLDVVPEVTRGAPKRRRRAARPDPPAND